MRDKWIAFYVSSHGFGHMTRNLAIMEEILEKTENSIYLASGKFQNQFAKSYLSKYKDRVLFTDLCTDVGLINQQNSLKVDVKRLEESLNKFIDSWEAVVAEEYEILKKLSVHCIINDVSPIGALVGKKLKIKTIGISNFTWVEQYEFLGVRESIIEAFKDAYSNLDIFMTYPLALPMTEMKVPSKKIDFITRNIDLEKINKIKEKYGDSIFITCGKSASLKSITIENYKGTIFTTSGIKILGSSRVVQLPVNTLDTQNYIAASDVVISKAGWSTISEAVTAKRNLVLIERDDILEDSYNIRQLKKQHLAISIKEEALRRLDMQEIELQCKQDIKQEENELYQKENSGILEELGIFKECSRSKWDFKEPSQ
ncbi:glycosyltransferase [Pisciglobus halotolerans]|uniref:Glycosyl transferase family 28 C-terminal domain-containing protein n=1 Tax=Pisciglobus halotolerans TaxID=745365 RepID=A0A1I3DM55_9LACT|nr:glycosyltransferase [Pisciglobus halotolerans]SFH87628.1 conserved hypothetical protein [Pisciglobus halotolerans]